MHMVSMKFLKEPTEEWHWLRASSCCSVHTEAMLLPTKDEAWWGGGLDLHYFIQDSPNGLAGSPLSQLLLSQSYTAVWGSSTQSPFLLPSSFHETKACIHSEDCLCLLLFPLLLSFKGISPRELLAFLIPSWHLLLIEPKLTYWISALRSNLWSCVWKAKIKYEQDISMESKLATLKTVANIC